MFCFCWRFIGYYGIATQIFKKYSRKIFFVFGSLWSNRSTFGLCCTSSFNICCVDFYLTQFLPYLFLQQKGWEQKPFRKTFYCLFIKALKALSVPLNVKNDQIFSILKTKSQHVNGCAGLFSDQLQQHWLNISKSIH